MRVQSLRCADGDAFDSDDEDGVLGDLEDDDSGGVSGEQQGSALGDGGISGGKDGAPTAAAVALTAALTRPAPPAAPGGAGDKWHGWGVLPSQRAPPPHLGGIKLTTCAAATASATINQVHDGHGNAAATAAAGATAHC